MPMKLEHLEEANRIVNNLRRYRDLDRAELGNNRSNPVSFFVIIKGREETLSMGKARTQKLLDELKVDWRLKADELKRRAAQIGLILPEDLL